MGAYEGYKFERKFMVGWYPKWPVEWCEIESHAGAGVFGKREVRGYIPRSVLENELGIDMSRKAVWFNNEQSEAMRKHPKWRTPEQFQAGV